LFGLVSILKESRLRAAMSWALVFSALGTVLQAGLREQVTKYIRPSSTIWRRTGKNRPLKMSGLQRGLV
jgi:hypothetical protein